MKKVVILAAAVAAIAACTKSQVVYDDNDVEIGLSPVNYMTTKTVYGPYDGTAYSDAEQFNVFAQHTTSPAGTAFSAAENLTPYLVDVTFGKKSSGYWGGTQTPYYWPKTGSLYFTGYSPAAAVKTSAEYDFNQGGARLTITDFQQGAYSIDKNDYAMVDLMYFDVHNTTKSVNSGVHSVTFRHALSWLDFNFKCDVDGLNNLFQIQKVTLTLVSNKETFTSGYGDSNNKWPKPAWTANNTGESLVLYSAGQDLTTTNFELHDVLVIPQKIDGVLRIEYTQRAAAGTPPISQVAELKLTGGDGSNNNTDSWLINKHYIYNITFSADEILLDPDIVSWDKAIVDNIEVL
ncbi:MAG TPA: fimbrillin family protein [Candidatus Cryptobacteroides intestinipullorum]|nr:fimbrillin family protein [Candidatus Cryptobacteroides intestinipullorum]